MADNAEFSPLPWPLMSRESIDLIHCNHYYNMPLGLRLKSSFGSPIILDTHDIQAYQMELRGARSYFLN
ncbi:MAG TPA: glycosyltransferase family 1 protein, partial [Pseudomonadota bacterium]|nr:glycosyltransferase family 1 protein [Pseudomonadota bacterium]